MLNQLGQATVRMITDLPTKRTQALYHSDRHFSVFTYKMAAKIDRHRYRTKLRHCHPMHIDKKMTCAESNSPGWQHRGRSLRSTTAVFCRASSLIVRSSRVARPTCRGRRPVKPRHSDDLSSSPSTTSTVLVPLTCPR